MTYQADFTLPAELLEQIASQGLDFIPELVRILVNAAMRAERENFLGAEPYQRSDQRQGQANGYKPKTVQTRMGDITFAIPQVRDGGFYPQALEKGPRSERALTLGLDDLVIDRLVFRLQRQHCRAVLLGSNNFRRVLVSFRLIVRISLCDNELDIHILVQNAGHQAC